MFDHATINEPLQYLERGFAVAVSRRYGPIQ